MQPTVPRQRLDGLDLARYAALVGMVIVNFDVVMVGGEAAGPSSALAELLQGRAAATFVVLAGIGFGLTAARTEWWQTVAVTIRRAIFLLAAGLLNALIFDADIIHYYAFYFLFGVLFMRASDRLLWLAMAGLAASFVALTGIFDYETGWDWTTYEYRDFWTAAGFVRNLFFNGWHPVIPWLAFLLFGIWLSRRDLASQRVQRRLVLIGGSVLAGTILLSRLLIGAVAPEDAEAAFLFGTEPVPPMPFYLIAGGAAASLTAGLCLMVAPTLASIGLLALLVPAGRQTLTLYIAHILIGMGILEALGMIGGQTGGDALIAAALFCAVATLYAALWARFFKRGPLEVLMRRLAG